MESFTVPLHKRGKTEDPDNYRGMSLISGLWKYLTHNYYKQKTDEFILEQQAGFRAGNPTGDQMFVLYFIVRRILCGKRSFACFVGFQKAYGTVDINQL